MHLNDKNPVIIARAVLLLHLARTIDADNDEDIQLLWALWNNAQLSQQHAARLRATAHGLIKQLPEGFYVPCAGDLQQLRELWGCWCISEAAWPSLDDVLADRWVLLLVHAAAVHVPYHSSRYSHHNACIVSTS